MVNLPGSKDCYTTIIDAALVRSILLRLSQHNHSHIMKSFSNRLHLYYFVHISSIKACRKVIEDLSLHRIERRFDLAIMGELWIQCWYVR